MAHFFMFLSSFLYSAFKPIFLALQDYLFFSSQKFHLFIP